MFSGQAGSMFCIRKATVAWGCIHERWARVRVPEVMAQDHPTRCKRNKIATLRNHWHGHEFVEATRDPITHLLLAPLADAFATPNRHARLVPSSYCAEKQSPYRMVAWAPCHRMPHRMPITPSSELHRSHQRRHCRLPIEHKIDGLLATAITSGRADVLKHSSCFRDWSEVNWE